MRLNNKFVLVLLIFTVVLCSYYAFGKTPSTLTSYCTIDDSGSESRSSPSSSCSLKIVKTNSSQGNPLLVKNPLVPAEWSGLADLPEDRDPSDCGCGYDLSVSSPDLCSSGVCQISCLTRDNTDMVPECAYKGDYWVVFNTPDYEWEKNNKNYEINKLLTTGEKLGDKVYQDPEGNDLICSQLTGADANVKRAACKLPEYSPEKYPMRCAGAVYPESTGIDPASAKGGVFLKTGPDGFRCCGNGDAAGTVDAIAIDDGMIYENHLCYGENAADNTYTAYGWIAAKDKPFKIYSIYRGSEYGMYDAVSNSEKWFVCGKEADLASHQTDLKILSPADQYVTKPGSAGDALTGSQGSSSTTLTTGYSVDSEQYVDDKDGDGYAVPEDCDDNPDDDFAQYDGKVRAWDIYPGAVDPCEDSINQDCDPTNTVCSTTVEVSTIDYYHLASTFLCEMHDDKGEFVQCCGADLNYCNQPVDKNGRIRLSGSLATTLKDFDNYKSTAMLSGTEIVKFDKNSNNLVAKLKLKGDYTEKPSIKSGDEYILPIFINQVSNKLNSDAEIHNFESYQALELFYATSTSYVLKLRLYGKPLGENEPNDDLSVYTELVTFDVKDYIVNSPNLGKWLHVIVPISELKQRFGKQSGLDLTNVRLIAFVANAADVRSANIGLPVRDGALNYDNIIYLDRISLKGSSDKYCVANKYDASGEKRSWISDLDSEQKSSFNNLPVAMHACVNTPSYAWTGTRCCGDDAGEYYAGDRSGCWAGNEITPFMRVGNVKLNIIDSTQKEVQKEYLCTGNSCVYPVTNVDDAGSYFVKATSTASFKLKTKSGTHEFLDQAIPIDDENGLIQASNIPLQATFSGGQFFGCYDDADKTDTNNINKPQGIDVADADHCAIVNSFFCSYPHGQVEKSEWSNETFYSYRDGKVIDSKKRNQTKAMPDLKDVPPTKIYSFFADFAEKRHEQGCCPIDFCFDGATCIDSINSMSIDATMFDNFRSSFAQDEWGVRDSDLGFDQFICYLDSQTKNASWQKAYFKDKWDDMSSGYCFSNESCWDGQQCVDPGYWDDDNYCDSGKWISRTKLVAEKLIQVALMRTDGTDFALFCDNYENVLNYYEYPVQGLDSLPAFLGGTSGMYDAGKSVNNFCVLTYPKDGQDMVVIGATLNKVSDNKLDAALSNFLKITPENENCDNDGAKTDDSNYHFCTDSLTNDRFWLNDKLGSVVYSRYGVDANTGASTIFSQMMETPIKAILKLMKKIFGRYHFDEDAYELDLLDQVDDFNTMYLAKNNNRNVLGYKESLFTPNSPFGALIIKFENFNADVCSKLINNPVYDAKCVVTIPKDQIDDDGTVNSKPVYVVTALKPDQFTIWHDATAKLRLHDYGESKGNFDASINYPNTNEYKFNIRDNLALIGSFSNEENIQSYYWDIDDNRNSDTVNGIFYGRHVTKKIKDIYRTSIEGYHKIKLITVGYGGEAQLSEISICINDDSYENYNADGTGEPNGCDTDDDDDGVLDDGDGSGIESDYPCKPQADPPITVNCDDNCRLVVNGPQADTNGDGIGDACSDDLDGDKVTNSMDAFPSNASASSDFDKDGMPDSYFYGWRYDEDIVEDDTFFKLTPLVEDLDDDNDGLADYPFGEADGCNINPDCDGDHLLDGQNKTIAKELAENNEYYKKWLDQSAYNIAHYLDTNTNSYVFLGEQSYFTSVMSTDSDGDGILDIDEIMPGSIFAIGTPLGPTLTYALAKTSPNNKDTDGDKLFDRDEIVIHNTNPVNRDTDGDGMDDGWEIRYGFNPKDASDGVAAEGVAAPDADADGLSNLQEYHLGTDPNNEDTDGDTYKDGDDPEPLKGNGPIIDVDSITPVDKSTIYFEHINQDVLPVQFSVDKPADCKWGYSRNDIQGSVTDVTELNKKAEVSLNGGENAVYIQCWDRTIGRNSMAASLGLTYTYDTKKIDVVAPASVPVFDDIKPTINVKINRKGTCKIKVSEERNDLAYIDADAKLMTPENSVDHSFANLDFALQVNARKQECLDDDPWIQVCSASASFNKGICDDVADDYKEMCNKLFTASNALKNNGDCSEAGDGFKAECLKYKDSSYSVLIDECDSMDGADKARCYQYANLAEGIKSGDLQFCNGAKVSFSECPECDDLSPICKAVAARDVNPCYAYCSRALGPYYYLVKCKDVDNDVFMESTYVGEVYFSKIS